MFGAEKSAAPHTSLAFVSQAGVDANIKDTYGLRKQTEAVKRTRALGKADMVHNNAMPHIEVDPERFEVRADGELLTCKPAQTVPLSQRYFLF